MGFYMFVMFRLAAMAIAGIKKETCYDDNTGSPLRADEYLDTCPEAEGIILSWVEKAVFQDQRMAASLLRLHFHDCFVNVSPVLPSSTFFFFFWFYTTVY